MTKRRGEPRLIVASLAAIAVAACGPTTESPPSLPATPTSPPAAAAPPTVSASGNASRADAPKSTDPLRPMTQAGESYAMPKPGQANDHSNPSAEPVPTPRQEPAR
jgi:hypothetical protein